MDIDLSQFTQVFFEESLEGLAVMEAELLNLDIDNPDSETINTIFRAAHSIKGGSGTFGFNAVANFTHLLETLLDEIRDGRREMQPEHLDILLHSVDVLRGMLDALMADTQYSDPKLAELKQQLSTALQTDAAELSSTPISAQAEGASSIAAFQGWKITFVAGPDIMRCGNDPQLMFNELRDIGELQVQVLTETMPQLNEFEPETCYLSWELLLETTQPLKKIKEAFEWVEDECDIHYEKLTSESVTNQTASEQSSSDNASTPAQTPSNCSPKATTTKAKNTDGTSIRVSTEKIDTLINMVGELVITQAMLGQISQQDEISQQSVLMLQQGLEQLASHTKDLQESVMQIRMIPISFAFNRFPRLVRDTSQQLGKKVDLVLKGEETELDKTVMEKIVDPMVHLVRNSLDHGLESPEDRVNKGKSEAGSITLNAYHQSGSIVIEIQDDGAGLNTQKILEKALDKGLVHPEEELSDDAIHQLIFKPGFSTADAVSDLSGRGVGMDVVKRNINELNGTIALFSRKDEGSRFTIRLPLTLSILDGQLVRIGEHTYVVPLISIHESLQVKPERINQLGDGHELIRLRDEYIPVVKLYQELGHQAQANEIKDGLVMVVDYGNKKIGLLVDELLAQQQVVIKNLEDNYTKIQGISGATILGNGTVALIIDIVGLVNLAGIVHSNEYAA